MNDNETENKKIGFLVHPRDYEDFFTKFPLAKLLPKWSLDLLTKYLPPIKVSRISGLQNHKGENIDGFVLSLPITAKTMLEHRSLARQKISEAVSKANDLEIGILALGGMNASLSKGGKAVADQNDVGVTTGRPYTVKNVTDYVIKIVEKYNLPKRKLQIAIVGAAGSIGSGCALRLEQKGYQNFLLIDLERKLDRIQNKMHKLSDSTKIKIDHQISKISEADIVIAATSAPEAVITERDVSLGTIVINDAQPSDIAESLYDSDGVVVIEGGVVDTPGVSPNVDMGMSSEEENFCCLVEAMILAKNDHFQNFSVGRMKLNQVDNIEEYAKQTEFSIATPQNKFGYIRKANLEDVANRIHERVN